MNWWLMALAFVLGLVLTGLFMNRRVTREVPVYESGKAAPARLVDETPKVETPKVKAPQGEVPDTRLDKGGTGSAAAGFAATDSEPPPGPHGPGSATPAPDGSGPVGWMVKGNEESKLYHSTESPSYGVTRAEVWFLDAPTAEAAGFNRWDSGKSQRGKWYPATVS